MLKRLLGTLVLVALIVVGAWLLRPKAKPNVLLLILDTLRADHLGVYGYQRDTSPQLDAFARENIVFMNVATAAPWTPPSLASIFTGLYPSSHGMMPPNARELAKKQAYKLTEKALTLAEYFGSHGYATAGISSNPWITPEFGFSQGYELYYTHIRKDAKFITREGKEVFDSITKSGRPFYVSLHYLDPHDPYTPPAPFNEMFKGDVPSDFVYQDEKMKRYLNQYDGEIRYLDTQLGDLFSYLKEKGLYDNTIIVIVSDHGEQFLEHGDHRHGFQLYNEEVHVPLILKLPNGGESRAVNEVVSTIDIFPTLVELTNLPAPDYLAGHSLLESKALKQRSGVLTEIDRIYHQRSYTSVDGKRLIAGTNVRQAPFDGDYAGNPLVVFDSFKDPRGERPLSDPAWRDGLKEHLMSELKNADSRKLGGGDMVTIQSDTFDQLKSLGYLE